MLRTTRFFSLAAGLCLAFGMTACSDDDSGGPCGNGVIDTAEGEVCDGSELGGASCASRGYTGGTLGCSDTCLEYDESACVGGDCGNGVVDAGEACDGTDHDGTTCDSLGLEPGNLVCMNNCTFNTSGCGAPSVCNNGIIEGDEQCDMFELDGETCESLNFEGGDLTCTASCTFNTGNCYNATMPVGAACLDSSDCNGGICWVENGAYHWGPPGGYCYEYCNDQNACPNSGPNATCIDYGGMPLCMLNCVDAGDCRPGYGCDPNVSVCIWGSCDDDAQCTVTGDCEETVGAPNFGVCVTPAENCTNGTDDDFDGHTDCADSECLGDTACPLGEICGDGIDNDGDGAVDCDDGECVNLGICSNEVCTQAGTATLSCGDSLTGENNDNTGSTNVIMSALCYEPDNNSDIIDLQDEYGPEYAYVLTVSQAQLVTLDVTNFTCDLDIYVIKETDLTGSPACDAHFGCFGTSYHPSGQDEQVVFAAYPGVTYYIVVDGWIGGICDYDIAVACATTGFEICDDAADNDTDGLVDCEDPECWGMTGCTTEALCSDGIDNDLDGALDCADSDCSATTDCSPGMGYWELWEGNGTDEVDLEGYQLDFVVDGGNPQGYTFTTTASATWIETPGSGTTSATVLTGNGLVDEGSVELVLPFNFDFQGTQYDRIWVTDNGYIAFEDDSNAWPGPNAWNGWQKPRIAPLWTDFDADTGTVSFDAFADRVVITWDGLEVNVEGLNPNRFQLVLYDNGNISMVFREVDDVANMPHWVAGFITMVTANFGVPPSTETNFRP